MVKSTASTLHRNVLELQRLTQLAKAYDPLTQSTAQRLREQLSQFLTSHPHYPVRHAEHIARRIDMLTGAAGSGGAQAAAQTR